MGTAERRKREIRERKDFIIEKSRGLFFEKGYNNVTIQDICKTVEYGRSVFYSHFKSKEELQVHIRVAGIAILADKLAEVETAGNDLAGQFLRCGEILFDFYQEHFQYFNTVFNVGGQTGLENVGPEISAEKDRETKRASEPLRRILRAGMENGLFRKNSIDDIVRLFWSTIVGIIVSYIQSGSTHKAEEVQRMCRKHSEIYLYSLLAENHT